MISGNNKKRIQDEGKTCCGEDFPSRVYRIDRKRYIPSKREYIKEFFEYLQENEYWNDCSPYEK